MAQNKTQGGIIRNLKGQISVMIAVMMSTFILLFAFVINTGMLVNAKINLQNAADLAAYAGAAVQARQLTQISYLNYEMRRQYKKFLFRIYVLGNMAQQSFPRGGGSGPMEYKPSLQSNADYGAPTTCIIFNPLDNYCQLDKLPKISIPPPSVLDAVTDTLSGQLSQIETIRQLNCKAIGTTNLILNYLWLYNTDPDLKNLDALGAQQSNTFQIIKGLATGLGIVPREMILSKRIHTLESYVNAKAHLGVTKSTVDGFANAQDPAPLERTAQAFYSAYYTLGNHTFPGDSISLDELLPGDSSHALLLKLKDIKEEFDTYAIDMDTGKGVGGDISPPEGSSPTGQDCIATSVAITLKGKALNLGVYKDPSILTYYSIRLKAKARILFSPFGDMEMKAYSAAQPFGSRIGPTADNVAFIAKMDSLPPNAATDVRRDLTQAIPNLAVLKQDAATRGAGWDTKDVVGKMYEALNLQNGGAGSVNSDMINGAYRVAMAPNPWEGTRYNIMNDQGDDPFVRNFGNGPGGPSTLAAFWAPVFPPGKEAVQAGDFKKMVAELFDESVVGNLGGSSDVSSNREKIKTYLEQGLEKYIGTSLRGGAGEGGEGMNIVRLENPFVTNAGMPLPGSSMIMTNATDFKTSWNSVNRADYRQLGRVGYSVKFVSFDSLTKSKNTTNGTDHWSNTYSADPESQQDIPFIKH